MQSAESMDSRPREERDLAEFYHNLNDSTPLEVFVSRSRISGSHSSGNAASGLVMGASARLCTFNSVLNEVKNLSHVSGTVTKPGKIGKSLQAYGYRSTTKSKMNRNLFYSRFHHAHSAHQLSSYDMDEQDMLYLDWLNSQKEAMKISPEAFEISISVLESEWHKLETRMIAQVGVGQDGRDDLKMDANFEKYGSDDGTGGVDSLSEQRCAVCNDSECDNTNSIVYCDGCNIAVHQECYGVAFIPEGQWFCRRCMVNRGSTVSCTFCPSKTGAFKQLDNGMWSHVVCALWIREVYFANPVYLEPIEGVASIPRSRWTLVCYICKQKVGACIQCAFRKCTQAYHVTCAKRAGLYMAMDRGVSGAIASNDTIKSYCDRHSPSHIDKEKALTGILRARSFYKDAHSLSRKNDRLAIERRQANRVNRFKWKTEHGTPIAPNVFVQVLVATLKDLKVGEVAPDRMLRGLGTNPKNEINRDESLRNLSAALCRYWCLKREDKNGASLVRPRASEQELVTSGPVEVDHLMKAANAASPRNREKDIRVPDKVEFGHSLEKDLQKLIHINSSATERQREIINQTNETFSMSNTAYFAFQTMAIDMIEKTSRIYYNSRDSKTEISEAPDCMLEQTKSDILNGLFWSASDVDRNVQRALRERSYNSTSSSADKATRFWNQTGLQELSSVEASWAEAIPFSEIRGLHFSLKKHNPSASLESEDLSEVDDDPFIEKANREVLRKFVSK